MFLDLKPYVCTFRECNLKMFHSRHEWFAHELQAHRREWICEYCTHESFATANSFRNHLRLTHTVNIKGSQLEAIVLQCEEPIDKIPAAACKLCNQWENEIQRCSAVSGKPIRDEKTNKSGSLSMFRKHLGRHMEQLALFALPIANNREDEAMDSEEQHSDSFDDEVALLNNPLTSKVEEEKSPSESTDKEGPQSERPVTSLSVPEFPSNPGHRIFFINGDNIDSDVITTDICRYLGNDALVKPGSIRVSYAH